MLYSLLVIIEIVAAPRQSLDGAPFWQIKPLGKCLSTLKKVTVSAFTVFYSNLFLLFMLREGIEM